jgi:hypothetical protein
MPGRLACRLVLMTAVMIAFRGGHGARFLSGSVCCSPSARSAPVRCCGAEGVLVPGRLVVRNRGGLEDAALQRALRAVGARAHRRGGRRRRHGHRSDEASIAGVEQTLRRSACSPASSASGSCTSPRPPTTRTTWRSGACPAAACRRPGRSRPAQA